MREARERELGPEGFALRDALDEFALANRGDPIVLAAVPATIAWARSRNAELAPMPAVIRRRELRPFVEERRRVMEGDPGFPGEYYVSGEVLVQADGQNHLAPVEPIMRRLGDPVRPPAVVRAPERELRAGTRRALRAARRMLRAVRRRGLSFPGDQVTPQAIFVMAAHALAHSRALLRKYEPSAVVVLATPNNGPRALVHTARELGVPSVYFPHTSVLTDQTLNDLPTDYAGLRGAEEVGYYEEVAGPSERIEVVGDPSMTEADELPAPDESLPPVLAPPIEEEFLRDVVPMVAEAVEGPVLVSPHPEADLDLLTRMIPPDWELWRDRTYDLLRKGPPMILQYTSGVSREALSLGIPAIELRLPPGRPIGYPMIREPHVRIVSTAAELRDAIEAARAAIADGAARLALRDWARRWSWPAGDEAARRGAELVRRAASGPPPGPIWSAWPGPGDRD